MLTFAPPFPLSPLLANCKPFKTGKKKENDLRSNVVRAKLFSPLFIRLPHDLGLGDIKLARPQEPQEGLVIETIIADTLHKGFLVGPVGDEARGEKLCSEGFEGGLLGL